MFVKSRNIIPYLVPCFSSCCAANGYNLIPLQSILSNFRSLIPICPSTLQIISYWYISDSTTSQGNVLQNITSQFGPQQIIKEPTHILDNSSSCIDLIFTSQPNLITESSVYPSLYPNCHHQLVYAKFNLQIYYPPQYYREV